MVYPELLQADQRATEKLDNIANIYNLMTDTDRLDLLMKLKKDHFEKRNNRRKDFFGLICYASPKGGHCDFIRNISKSGVFIETNHRMSIGEMLSMTFATPGAHKHLKVNGKVTRMDQRGIGVQFQTVDQDQENTINNIFESI